MENYSCQSEPTRLTRVGSPRVGLEIVELNPAHFLVSQKFFNPAQPTTGWWVEWVGSLTRIKIKKKDFFFLKKSSGTKGKVARHRSSTSKRSVGSTTTERPVPTSTTAAKERPTTTTSGHHCHEHEWEGREVRVGRKWKWEQN